MIERVIYLLEILSMVLCLHIIYGKKFRLNIKNVVLVSVNVIYVQAINEGVLPKQYILLMYMLLFFYCCLEFGFNKKETIINNILCFVLIFILQIVCCIFMVLLQFGEIQSNYLLLIENMGVLVLVMVVLPQCKLDVLSYYMQQKNVLVNLALLASFGFVVYTLVSFRILEFLKPENYLVIIISVGLIFVLVYQWQQNRFKVKEQDMELQLHQLYDAAFQSLLTEIRGKQHDFENHINAIYSQHYTCTTYEELVERQEQYCKAMMKNNKYNKLLRIGKSTIIGFLYGKFVQAEEKQVEVQYRVSIEKLECVIPTYKFVEIIGNLFDNAVEAVTSENFCVNKVIFLELMESEESIIFTISNPSKYLSQKELEEMFQRGKSSKGENRGIGLANVKKICNEYHCMLGVENKEEGGENYIEFSIEIKK